MTLRVRFDSLALQTTEHRYVYAFDSVVTTIVGPVGAGKTSALELLRYAIGGGGLLSKAVRSSVHTVTVQMTFPTQRLVFTRRIGESTVEVVDAGGETVATLAVGASKQHRLASDFLREAAGLPAMTVTASRGSRKGKSDRLGFFDVLRYCYVPQAEIDRSIVRHLDTALARKRKTTFEMLFGLSDLQTAEADAVVGRVTEELASARLADRTVARFLTDAQTRDEQSLTSELERLDVAIAAATNRLAALRTELKVATINESGAQTEATRLADRLRLVTHDAHGLEAIQKEHAKAIAQLDLEEERLSRSESAGRHFDGLEFARCPRCLQSVQERGVPAGSCRLCLQPTAEEEGLDPDADSALRSLDKGSDLSEERRRIESLRTELRALSAEDGRQLKSLMTEQRSLQVTLREVLADIDRKTSEFVSPRFDLISDLSAELSSASARRAAMVEASQLRAQHRRLSAIAREKDNELSAAKAAALAARTALAARRSILPELSDTFNEMVQLLEPPWYQSARIDPVTYLPVLNDSPFENLSGGEKTVVNVAYHLALLSLALARRDTLLPALLILDTPRKNLGVGDQALAVRIYRQVDALATTYPNGFQMIVADNDPPTGKLARSKTIELTYEQPLIPDVEHPGPDVETLSAPSPD